MSIIVRRRDILDFCILWLLLLSVMIIRWLDFTGYVNIIIIMLITVSIVKEVYYYLREKIILILLIVIIYLFFNYFMFGGEFFYLMKNIYEILTPMLIMIYMVHLMLHKEKFLLMFFKKCFWPLNIYTLINIPILLLQLGGQYWLAGLSKYTNTFADDLISGLFGFNGVHMLALYSAFIFFYNLTYYKFWLLPKYRMIFVYYNIFLVLFFLIISQFNDNHGFYLVLAMNIGVYYIIVNYAKVFKNITLRKFLSMLCRVILFCFLLGVIFYYMYKFTAIGSSIDRSIHEFKVGLTYMSGAHGSNERFGMIAYIFSDIDNRLLGYGVGNYQWTTPYAFGFWHYGQSDMGTFLCLGGIVFVVFISLMVLWSFKGIYKNYFIPMTILIMFYVLAIFTQIFTVTSLMVSTMLFMVSCFASHQLTVIDK